MPIPIGEVKQFISTNFVVKLLAWLNKQSSRVVTHEEYMKVYQQIIYQCDTEDNNEQVYDIFEEFVTEYLDQHVMSRLRH